MTDWLVILARKRVGRQREGATRMSEKRYGSTARTAGRRTTAMAQEETITLSGGCSWCLKEKKSDGSQALFPAWF